METVFIEATQGKEHGLNWGKFMVGRFTEDEWARRSAMLPTAGLLRSRGHDQRHLLVMDLETREGAFFRIGGLASADLHKHRVWVCPMFEPFLAWLYEQDVSDLAKLPKLVELPDAPAAMYGYRRSGQGADLPPMKAGQRRKTARRS